MNGMTDEDSGIRSTLEPDGVYRITIDRPRVANALSPRARTALTGAFHRANETPEARAVLLSATGARHFCTGAGLDADTAVPARPGEPGPHGPGVVAHMLQSGWQRLIGAVLDCRKPVVAAVNGTAAGAGASLVLASDLVVMSTQAKMAEVFVERGVVPDSGAIHLLTRIVGLRRATEILMLGEPLDAQACDRLGIVNRVVDPGELDECARQLARRLAAGPTVMLGLTKRLLAVSSESSRERAFDAEAWAQDIVSRTADLQEGLRAFGERRPPRFEGC